MSEKVRNEHNTTDFNMNDFNTESVQEDTLGKLYMMPRVIDINLNELDNVITCSCSKDDLNPWG